MFGEGQESGALLRLRGLSLDDGLVAEVARRSLALDLSAKLARLVANDEGGD